jgi:hypothetical protein
MRVRWIRAGGESFSCGMHVAVLASGVPRGTSQYLPTSVKTEKTAKTGRWEDCSSTCRRIGYLTHPASS